MSTVVEDAIRRWRERQWTSGSETEPPHLETIAREARTLVAHYLPGWTFAFNRQRRTLGLCRYRERRIELSRLHAKAGTAAQARSTVLHEIAHGLAGPGTAHGPVWQRIMRELGEEPAVTACTEYQLNDYRWALVRLEGTHLHWIAGRYRRPKRTDHWALRGSPDTLGTVYFCAWSEFCEWEQGERALEAVRLFQR